MTSQTGGINLSQSVSACRIGKECWKVKPDGMELQQIIAENWSPANSCYGS